jgi:hypothetical protein
MNNLPSTSWAISPMAICQQRSKYRSVRFRPGRHSDPLRASDLASVRSHRQSLQTHPPCAAYAATGTTEQTFTLEGSLEDSKGSVGADDFVWRPGGNIHVAHAPNAAMFISIFNVRTAFSMVRSFSLPPKNAGGAGATFRRQSPWTGKRRLALMTTADGARLSDLLAWHFAQL